MLTIRMDNWIRSSVRTRARRRLIFALVVLAVIGLSVYHKRYALRNAFQGPVDATAADLDAGLNNPTGHNWFHVHGTRVIDTGLEQITTDRIYGVTAFRRKSAEYSVVQVGDRALLVKSKVPGVNPTGEVWPIPDDVAADVFSGVSPENRAHFYPYILDGTGNYRLPVYIGMVFSLLFGIPALITVPRMIGRLGNIAGDPSVRRLEDRPGAKDYVRQAEEERQQPLFKGLNDTVTENFVISEGFFNVRALFLEDLLWAYVETEQTRGRNTGAGRSTYLWLRFERNDIMVKAEPSQAESVQQEVQQRVPWAVFGYTREVSDYFSKDKPAFIEWVGNRRRAVQRGDSPDSV